MRLVLAAALVCAAASRRPPALHHGAPSTPGVLLEQFPTTAFAPQSAKQSAIIASVNASGLPALSTARFVGFLMDVNTESANFTVVSDGTVRLWVDDNLFVDGVQPAAMPGGSGVQLQAFQSIMAYPFIEGVPAPFKLEVTFYSGGPGVVQLYWAGNATSYQFVPPAAFVAAGRSPWETQRQAMRDRMLEPPVTWGTYNHMSLGTHSMLPAGFALDVTLANTASGDVLGDIIVYRDAKPAVTRVGPHSYNGSDYTQLQLDGWNGAACTVVLTTTVVNLGRDLNFIATGNGSSCGNIAVLVQPRLLWGFAGVIAGDGPGIVTATLPGFGAVTAYATQPSTALPRYNSSVYWCFSFAGASANAPVSVGFSTGSNYSLPAMQAAIAVAAARQAAALAKYGPALSSVYDAMSSAIAWNTIYTPLEGVITPVSRGWDFLHGDEDNIPGNGYVLFDWDNIFLAHMASLERASLDIAYSNLIQIIQSRTLEGLVPNYAAGIFKSYDRTEPQIGAYVTLRLYKKWGDAWLVQVLFDALFGWHDWVWNHRRGEGVLSSGTDAAPLVVLGTDPSWPHGDAYTNELAGARLESGLDDSPMYDGVDGTGGPVQFNSSSHHMMLYDVGMTSFFLSDTQALMELAVVANRSDLLPLLQDRFAIVQSALNEHLWDSSAGIYSNMLYNGSFYPRYSPTSFFPAMSQSCSDDQAAGLAAWLTSPTGFCVNDTHTGPAGSSMLIQYFDGSHDNAECATDDCIQAQILAAYNFVRIEALVATAPSGGAQQATAPLYHYYSAAAQDHALTTNSTPPAAGYDFVRIEGYCFPQAGPNLVNLTLWYSANRSDYKVCGTDACLADAGYVLVQPLCFAYNATGLDNLPCKYGVPSIARSDPAFFDNGYWRGRIWGPHIQLTYWSINNYAHVPAMDAARKVLVAQATDLLETNWRLFRHINENSNGITGTGESQSSDWFYHWGALPAAVAFEEAGLL